MNPLNPGCRRICAERSLNCGSSIRFRHILFVDFAPGECVWSTKLHLSKTFGVLSSILPSEVGLEVFPSWTCCPPECCSSPHPPGRCPAHSECLVCAANSFSLVIFLSWCLLLLPSLSFSVFKIKKWAARQLTLETCGLFVCTASEKTTASSVRFGGVDWLESLHELKLLPLYSFTMWLSSMCIACVIVMDGWGARPLCWLSVLAGISFHVFLPELNPGPRGCFCHPHVSYHDLQNQKNCFDWWMDKKCSLVHITSQDIFLSTTLALLGLQQKHLPFLVQNSIFMWFPACFHTVDSQMKAHFRKKGTSFLQTSLLCKFMCREELLVNPEDMDISRWTADDLSLSDSSVRNSVKGSLFVLVPAFRQGCLRLRVGYESSLVGHKTSPGMLWINNCKICHSVYLIPCHTDAQWREPRPKWSSCQRKVKISFWCCFCLLSLSGLGTCVVGTQADDFSSLPWLLGFKTSITDFHRCIMTNSTAQDLDAAAPSVLVTF